MNREQADIETIIAKEYLFTSLADSDVLITGATGLIGSMLGKALLEANDAYSLNINVIGQVRNLRKAETVYGDRINRLRIISDYDTVCDYVIHTVSPTASRFFIEHPVETIKCSLETTIAALELAQKNKAKMVYLSSMEQYGVPYERGQIMTEDKIGIIEHLNVRSSYSESKRLCECLCASYAAEYGLDVKIARLAQTFGAGAPLSDNRMPMQFAKAVAKGEDIVLHTEGNSISNFVYLTDAITGILTILEKGHAGQAYNICNDKESRCVREIAELLSQKVSQGNIGFKIEIPKTNQGYAPDSSMYLNSDKLRRLGWKPEVDMAESYRRLAEYLSND